VNDSLQYKKACARFAQAFYLMIPDTDVLIRGSDIPGSSWCIQMLPLLSKGATTTLFAYAEQ